jgi:hypothetical protein
MKMMTALALVLASAPAAYAASLDNESFIEQVGVHNTATVSQTNGNNAQGTFQAGKDNVVTTSQISKLATGKNTSGNVQVGNGNTASTVQTNTPPNPLFTTSTYTNNSFSAQYGVKNDSTVGQTGGQNTQGAIQAGKNNESIVSQSDTSVAAGAANTSFTGQFGVKNLSTTSQKSADSSPDAFEFENGHSNASTTLQFGNGNEASTQQQSVGGTGLGAYNAAATVQMGNGNIAVTKQGGSVGDDVASLTPQTNTSFVGQFGTMNGAQVTQANGGNNQAAFQTGYGNIATVDQKTQVFGTGSGTNNALTTQFGAGNQATVSQAMVAVPVGAATGNNNSFISQIGGSNVVNSAQTTGQQASAANNTQVALQVGYGNSATVSQSTAASVTNTSFTAQYGAHNVAVVTQK